MERRLIFGMALMSKEATRKTQQLFPFVEISEKHGSLPLDFYGKIFSFFHKNLHGEVEGSV